MADAITGVTEILAEDVISMRVQAVLIEEMKVWPLMSDYTDQVGPGMDSVKIPKISSFTVASKAENTAVDAQVNAVTSDDLPLTAHKVIQFLLEDIASVQSKIDLVANYIDVAARDLAADMDVAVLTELDDNPSTSAPDHDVKYNDTSNNDLEKVDILEARRLLNVQKVPSSQRWAIIPPDKEKDLMGITEFTRVDEAGASAALRNGQIGRLFGFDVIMTTLIPTSGVSLFGHASSMAVARQIAPKIEMDRDLANLSDRHSISHLYGVKLLDAGKRFVRFTET